MDKETFDKEINMCKELFRKNGGKCNWGECEKCGVIPLLYKLANGKIYEKEAEVENLKHKILNK